MNVKNLKQRAEPRLLSAEQFEEISEVLADLASQSKASVLLFANMNGELICQRGDTEQLDTNVLSALAASDFSATAEMARMVGERDQFKLLFHEGQQKSIYICNVGEEFFLLVIFDKSVTLGMVRVYARKAVERITHLLETTEKEAVKLFDIVDSEFRSLLGDQLNKILR